MLPVRSALTAIPRVSRFTTRPLISRAYHEKVISHYEHPRNVGGSFLTLFRGQVRLSDNLCSILVGGLAPQKRHRCWYRTRRRTCVRDLLPPPLVPRNGLTKISPSLWGQLRRRYEVADTCRRKWCHLGRQVQNVWLRKCYCLEFVYD